MYDSIMETRRNAPRGLGNAGKRLWHDALSEFTFNPVELRLLEQLCRTVDECAAMERALATSGPMVAGSKGQVRCNPLLSQLASHRKLADQLATALALPTDTEAVGRRRSAQAKAAADARWRKTKTPAGRVSHFVSPDRRGA